MLATDGRARPSLRWILVVVALAVVAFVIAIAVQRNIFPFYSGDHDEPVYRFQAELLRDGRLNVPLAQNEFFRPWLSGPHDGHLVMAFTPGWPAVLMVSDLLFGSMLIAVGAVAAMTVVAAFAFTRELLGSTSRAVLATVILMLSPFVMLLGGTYLNYVFALGLYLLFGALLLGGLRSDSTILLVVSGLVLGVAFLTRPYDAILFALPFAGYIIATHRHDLRKIVKIAAWVALGVAPGLVVMLAYNAATSGSLLEFPTSVQSGGYSRFGWGIRSIAPDTARVNFTVGKAFSSLGTNLWALPTWLFGTYLTLALAVFGAIRLWWTDRAKCGLLLGLVFVFPIGYLAWWASALTTNGALDGIGPHYYLPVVAPLAILAAHGIAEAAAHRRAVLIGGLVAALVLTAIALPPKLSDKSNSVDIARQYTHDVERGLRGRNGAPALVIQERRTYSYIMEPIAYLGNPPDLNAPVLYARDRGARTIDLLDSNPGRRAYRIVRQLAPGGTIERIPVVVKPQSVLRAPSLAFHTAIVNATGKPIVTVYARFAGKAERRVLDTHSTKGKRYEVTWIVDPAGLEYRGPTAPRVPAPKAAADTKGAVIVGATFAETLTAKDPDAVERRYYARIRRNGVELLTADAQWTRFGTPIHAWLPIGVAETLVVRPSRN